MLKIKGQRKAKHENYADNLSNAYAMSGRVDRINPCRGKFMVSGDFKQGVDVLNVAMHPFITDMSFNNDGPEKVAVEWDRA